MNPCEAFIPLHDLDPALAQRLGAACQQRRKTLTHASCRELVQTLLEAFSLEINFGQAVADGGRALLEAGTSEAVALYAREVRHAGWQGAGPGRSMARFAAPVLLTGDQQLWAAFQRTLQILGGKGSYLVTAPMEGLVWLLTQGDHAAAQAYLELLQSTFDRPLRYNRCQYLGNLIPRALQGLTVSRRRSQLVQWRRAAAADIRLTEPFLEGLARGLNRLSDRALSLFVDQVLDAARGEEAVGFLALRTAQSRQTCQALQTALGLEQVQGPLRRYLQARTGRPICLAPLTALPELDDEARTAGNLCATDGLTVFLPETVDVFDRRQANRQLLETMAKFEAALIEFDTFRFDLARARDLGLLPAAAAAEAAAGTDIESFCRSLPHFALAIDLFTLFEHARLRVRLQAAYPGLIRKCLPLFQAEAHRRLQRDPAPRLMLAAYAHLALDMDTSSLCEGPAADIDLILGLGKTFQAHEPARMRVEHCAALVQHAFPLLAGRLRIGQTVYHPLQPPFRMGVQAGLHRRVIAPFARQAAAMADRLRARGFKLYPADLRLMLQRNRGQISGQEMAQLVRQARESMPPAEAMGQGGDRPPAPCDWQAPRSPAAEAPAEDEDDVERIHLLPEWSRRLGDYLHDHVRVRDRRPRRETNGYFVEVLQRREGLVRRLRYAFELLRPEGLKILRQWVEGDAFDYRALIDYAIERRAGLTPSEKIYIKRLKQQRDVAALLLLDLSRSTANRVEGSRATVLDVAKEAVVLFSQALEVVGDRYAVAGFSGTGRLGVDYFRIKDFDEPLSDEIKGSIGRLTPQRNTRMGAAIRRAARDLLAVEARVRLLIVIGDGFPNDLDYKQDDAIADTRQAIGEARARQIYTHAITVNLPTSPRLDALYGPVRHTLISDVRELPDKLLRLYATLTRI
jgi:nitric oxide reductase NorD protein